MGVVQTDPSTRRPPAPNDHRQNAITSFKSRTTLVPAFANTIGPAFFTNADYAIGGADGELGRGMNWQGFSLWVTLRHAVSRHVPFHLDADPAGRSLFHQRNSPGAGGGGQLMSNDSKSPRLLAVMAHPDDAEILVGGTLFHLKALGWEIGITTMTAGDCDRHDGPGRDCKNSLRRSAECRGLPGSVVCLCGTDGRRGDVRRRAPASRRRRHAPL